MRGSIVLIVTVVIIIVAAIACIIGVVVSRTQGDSRRRLQEEVIPVLSWDGSGVMDASYLDEPVDTPLTVLTFCSPGFEPLVEELCESLQTHEPSAHIVVALDRLDDDAQARLERMFPAVEFIPCPASFADGRYTPKVTVPKILMDRGVQLLLMADAATLVHAPLTRVKNFALRNGVFAGITQASVFSCYGNDEGRDHRQAYLRRHAHVDWDRELWDQNEDRSGHLTGIESGFICFSFRERWVRELVRRVNHLMETHPEVYAPWPPDQFAYAAELWDAIFEHKTTSTGAQIMLQDSPNIRQYAVEGGLQVHEKNREAYCGSGDPFFGYTVHNMSDDPRTVSKRRRN